MSNAVEKPVMENRQARIRTLQTRVHTRRRQLAQRGSNVVLPLAGLTAGLLVPLSTHSRSLNPVKQVAALGKRVFGKLVRVAVLDFVLLTLAAKTSTGSKASEPPTRGSQ